MRACRTFPHYLIYKHFVADELSTFDSGPTIQNHHHQQDHARDLCFQALSAKKQDQETF